MPFATEDRILSLIAEHLDVPLKYVQPHTTFEELGGDSLDVIEMVMILEEEFDITLNEDELEACSSVEDVIKMVKEELGQ